MTFSILTIITLLLLLCLIYIVFYCLCLIYIVYHESEIQLYASLVDIIRNCWVKTKILSPTQAEDLRSRTRQNNRMASDESSGLQTDVVDALSDMMKKMGQKMHGQQLSQDSSPSVEG